MKFEIRINGCKRTAMIESMLRIAGAQELIDSSEILFGDQIDFQSNVFHHDLKIPTGRRFGMFRNWLYVTFYYDRGEDMGKIRFRGEDRQLVEQILGDLKLLEQQADLIIDNSVLKTSKDDIDQILRAQDAKA